MAVDIRAINGYELAAHTDWAGEISWSPVGDPHFSQGCCWLGPPSGLANRDSYHNGVPLSGYSSKNLYQRMYLQLETLPSDGDGMICLMQARQNLNSNCCYGIWLDSTGHLLLVNYNSSSYDIVATSTNTLSLHQWYRIECGVHLNTAAQVGGAPYESNAWLEVRVDGTQWAYYTASSYATNTGIHITTSTAYWQFSYFGLTTRAHTGFSGATATDCYGFMDSLAVATGDWIGEGYVGCITPTSPGSVSGWGVTTANDELAYIDHYSDATGEKYTSTTALDEVTFTLPTLESLGYGTPRFVQVAILSGSTAYTGEYVIKINGVTTRVSGTIGSGVWRFADMPVTIQPTDTVEVGIRKDNTATSRMFTRVALYFETDTYNPPVVDDTVSIAYGSYTGTGADQAVTVGFEPDLIIITSVANYHPWFWCRTASRTNMPAWQIGGVAASNAGAIFCRMTSTGFTVRDSNANSNAVGTTYDWIAVKDRTQRVVCYGAAPYWSGLDDWDVTLKGSAGFTPTTVIAKGQSRTVSIGSEWLRGPGHTGDQSNKWAAALVGDYAKAGGLQAVGSGTFQLGDAVYAVSIEFVCYVAVRDTNWLTNSLWRTYTYTGNGSSPRDIALPSDMLTKTPRWLLVQAAEYPGSNKYGYIKSPSMVAGGSKSLAANQGTVGITGWDVGEFTVDGDLNANGKVYNVFVMADGDDENSFITANAPLITFEIRTLGIWWPGLVTAPRTWPVQCEQRYFPVEPENRTHRVGCEQRTFNVDPWTDRMGE
jgi:hypothetical protein